MITIQQLQMHNVAPRGVTGSCVPTALCFLTGAHYQDVEYVLTKEQPETYRPDIKGNGGVLTHALLKKSRKLFGHLFTSVSGTKITVGTLTKYYPTGTYLVTRPRHAFVLKDGVIYDGVPIKHKETVTGLWKVEKAA